MAKHVLVGDVRDSECGAHADAEVRSLRAPGRPTRRIAAALATASLLLVSGRAAADGAFPDAQNILTPQDRPDEILVATNFGVVFSEDGGRTWLWTCEQDANSLGWLYQIGLPPRHRVFTLANQLLVYSDDLTCGWHIAGGGVTGQEISDAWVDRAAPDRVLAIGARCCEGDQRVYSLFESTDGGTTFGGATYVATSGDSLTGVESSVSDPATIYLTMSVGPSHAPTLARSSDGGGIWQLHDLTASLGPGNVRLAAVDPQDARKVFLLWSDSSHGQALAVTEDGGATATIRWQPTANGAVLKALVATSTGAVLLVSDVNGVDVLHRSKDGGLTFEDVPGSPHIRGLSRRGSVVYAATDNFSDGFALATSPDDGTTWTPLMSYDQVQAIAGCVRSVCQNICMTQAPLLWSEAVCSASGPTPGNPASGGTGCSVGPVVSVSSMEGGTAIVRRSEWMVQAGLAIVAITWSCCLARRRTRARRG